MMSLALLITMNNEFQHPIVSAALALREFAKDLTIGAVLRLWKGKESAIAQTSGFFFGDNSNHMLPRKYHVTPFLTAQCSMCASQLGFVPWPHLR